jgi:hypothetical protein
VNRYDANLEPILWTALAGWGVGESREEIAALPLAYPNGRQTTWPEVVRMFCEMHRGSRHSEPYLVGAFLSFCVSNSLLTGHEQLRALEREEQQLDDAYNRRRDDVLARRARRRIRVVTPPTDATNR